MKSGRAGRGTRGWLWVRTTVGNQMERQKRARLWRRYLLLAISPRIDKHKIHNGISCEHSAPIVLLYLSSLPPSAYRQVVPLFLLYFLLDPLHFPFLTRYYVLRSIFPASFRELFSTPRVAVHLASSCSLPRVKRPPRVQNCGCFFSLKNVETSLDVNQFDRMRGRINPSRTERVVLSRLGYLCIYGSL